MTKEELNAVYKAKVAERVAANSHSSWGGKDSLAVVEVLCDTAYGVDEGFDFIREKVGLLINPSAFRQTLEKLAPAHPCYVKPKKAEAAAELAGM